MTSQSPAVPQPRKPHVLAVYGTRPEAIKMAPLIAALRADQRLMVTIAVTAQHREMLDQVNRVFGIRPDTDLDLMTPGQTLNGLFARVVAGLDEAYAAQLPDAVLVQGDTTSVAAAGVSAFNRGIRVIHLEAGLRSGDLGSPFPEEGNRKLVSQIAALHLAPTAESKANLLAEGVRAEDIAVTGNTVIDALHWTTRQAPEEGSEEVRRLVRTVEERGGRLVLLTTHRRENLGSSMRQIGRAVERLARSRPDVSFVWPAHRNPLVREAVLPAVRDLSNVTVLEPLGYAEFTGLLAASALVLTDSGGVQEEAPSLGKPVLVLRENTERPEAVAAGTVRLIGTDEDRIVREVGTLLDDPDAYRTMANAVNPYGDGHAAERGAAAIASLFSLCPRLPDFAA